MRMYVRIGAIHNERRVKKSIQFITKIHCYHTCNIYCGTIIEHLCYSGRAKILGYILWRNRPKRGIIYSKLCEPIINNCLGEQIDD